MKNLELKNKQPKWPLPILIEPDNGKLVESFVDESQRDLKSKEALNLSKIKLTKIDVEWVHVLSER